MGCRRAYEKNAEVCLSASMLLATNARMVVAKLVAPKTKRACIRGFLVGSY